MHYAEEALINAIRGLKAFPPLAQKNCFRCSLCFGLGKTLEFHYSFRKISFEYTYINEHTECTLMCLNFNAESTRLEILAFYNNISLRGYIDKVLPAGKRIAEFVTTNPTDEQKAVFEKNYSEILSVCNNVTDFSLQTIDALLKKENSLLSLNDFGFTL